MRIIFSIVLIICAPVLFAAPLEGGFAQAPKASASQQEKERAFLEARNKVIASARTYENTPYRYGGLNRTGLDCSGFIYASFKDALNVNTPRSSKGLYTWTEATPLEKAQPGDLLFFTTDGSGSISHVALYLGDRNFIHSASSGPVTGVIYSSLEEKYWANAYVSAGRAFPEAPSTYRAVLASGPGERPSNTKMQPAASPDTWGTARGKPASASASSGNTRILAGLAVAPTWAAFQSNSNIIRGAAGQLHLGLDTSLFNRQMYFGLQIRPEYDGGLGVFRLPATLAWGPSDKIMIFAGPAISFGEAKLTVDNNERRYAGGTHWLGAIGVTAAPFTLETSSGVFAPYVEAAWQRYISKNDTKNTNADFLAGFRFSTGLKWTIQVR
jgi:probable lipoprotein NlpC